MAAIAINTIGKTQIDQLVAFVNKAVFNNHQASAALATKTANKIILIKSALDTYLACYPEFISGSSSYLSSSG